ATDSALGFQQDQIPKAGLVQPSGGSGDATAAPVPTMSIFGDMTLGRLILGVTILGAK
ncbi:hypothetical protein pipiens_005456, partial [Culex pipiens pipiens]